MGRYLFMTDLDGTILFSKKRINGQTQLANADNNSVYKNTNADTICVEYYNDEPFGYMLKSTSDTLDKLHRERSLTIIPVTTRSVSQYNRITFPDYVKHAYVDNGTVHVVHPYVPSDTDAIPRAFLPSMAGDKLDRYEKLFKRIERRDDVTSGAIADNMFAYVCCKTPEDAENLKHDIAEQMTDDIVTRSGRKIYITEAYVTKAHAVKTERRRDDKATIIAAGDTELDIPMMLQADYAIVPSDEMEKRLLSAIDHAVWNGYKSPLLEIYNANADNDVCAFSRFIESTLDELTK